MFPDYQFTKNKNFTKYLYYTLGCTRIDLQNFEEIVYWAS